MTKLDGNQPRDRSANIATSERSIMNIIHFFMRQPLTSLKMNYIHYKTSDDPKGRIHQNWEEIGA
jgi:hypothetical protein